MKNDFGSELSRKDFEFDLNVDLGDRNDDNEYFFGIEILLVDIYERLMVERLDRELFLVLFVIFEMSKKMEVLRKFWESGIVIGCLSNYGGVWEEILCILVSVGFLIVGMLVVELVELRLSYD